MADDSLYMAIVNGIATARGDSPGELDELLCDYVDIDVIEALERSNEMEWQFQFTIPNYVVTVESSGTVAVERCYLDDLDDRALRN